MSLVEWAGIVAALRHVAAGVIDRIPIGGQHPPSYEPERKSFDTNHKSTLDGYR